MMGKSSQVGRGEQDEFSVRSVMVTQAPSKLKYVTDEGRDQPERLSYRSPMGSKAIHQHYPRHNQQQTHNGAPIQCLLKNEMAEYGDEKNPEPRPGGVDHRDRQRNQGEGQAVERGRVAPDQRQGGHGAGEVLAHGSSMVPQTSKATAITRKT